MMRAVSLSQPEADIIANGGLRLFTRANRTPYRGPLAIHAVDADWGPHLPRRAIVATGLLIGVVEFDLVKWSRDPDRVVVTRGETPVLPVAQRKELRAVEQPPTHGGIQRWVYVLDKVERSDPPVDCRGLGGGLWAVPADIEAELNAAPVGRRRG